MPKHRNRLVGLRAMRIAIILSFVVGLPAASGAGRILAAPPVAPEPAPLQGPPPPPTTSLSVSDEPLIGGPITFGVSITNPNPPCGFGDRGFNLHYEMILPPGITFQTQDLASVLGEPTVDFEVLTDTPNLGETQLRWRNIKNLECNESLSFSVTAIIEADVNLGTNYLVTGEARYVNSPDYFDLFDANWDALPIGGFIGYTSGVQNVPFQVQAIDIEKVANISTVNEQLNGAGECEAAHLPAGSFCPNDDPTHNQFGDSGDGPNLDDGPDWQYSYTLQVQNNFNDGGFDTTNVLVYDVLPPGVAYFGLDPGGTTCNISQVEQYVHDGANTVPNAGNNSLGTQPDGSLELIFHLGTMNPAPRPGGIPQPGTGTPQQYCEIVVLTAIPYNYRIGTVGVPNDRVDDVTDWTPTVDYVHGPPISDGPLTLHYSGGVIGVDPAPGVDPGSGPGALPAYDSPEGTRSPDDANHENLYEAVATYRSQNGSDGVISTPGDDAPVVVESGYIALAKSIPTPPAVVETTTVITYRLTVQVSEYYDFSQDGPVVYTDIVPDGQTPIWTINPGCLPGCAGGIAPISTTHNVPNTGEWTIVWHIDQGDPITSGTLDLRPGAGEAGNFLEFQTVVDSTYDGPGRAGEEVVGFDSMVNTAHVQGVWRDQVDPDRKHFAHSQSSASVEIPGPQLFKKLYYDGEDCAALNAIRPCPNYYTRDELISASVDYFSYVDDVVHYELEFINPLSSTDVRNIIIDDFIPRGQVFLGMESEPALPFVPYPLLGPPLDPTADPIRFQDSAALPALGVPGCTADPYTASPTVTTGGANLQRISWNLCSVAPGTRWVARFRARVVDDPVVVAPVPVQRVSNYANAQGFNTLGESYSLRRDVTINYGGPELTLTKSCFRVDNSGNPIDNDPPAGPDPCVGMRPGDRGRFTLELENTGEDSGPVINAALPPYNGAIDPSLNGRPQNAIWNYYVIDRLPVQLRLVGTGSLAYAPNCGGNTPGSTFVQHIPANIPAAPPGPGLCETNNSDEAYNNNVLDQAYMFFGCISPDAIAAALPTIPPSSTGLAAFTPPPTPPAEALDDNGCNTDPIFAGETAEFTYDFIVNDGVIAGAQALNLASAGYNTKYPSPPGDAPSNDPYNPPDDGGHSQDGRVTWPDLTDVTLLHTDDEPVTFQSPVFSKVADLSECAAGTYCTVGETYIITFSVTIPALARQEIYTAAVLPQIEAGMITLLDDIDDLGLVVDLSSVFLDNPAECIGAGGAISPVNFITGPVPPPFEAFPRADGQDVVFRIVGPIDNSTNPLDCRYTISYDVTVVDADPNPACTPGDPQCGWVLPDGTSQTATDIGRLYYNDGVNDRIDESNPPDPNNPAVGSPVNTPVQLPVIALDKTLVNVFATQADYTARNPRPAGQETRRGDFIVYNLLVNNTGDATAFDVSVEDVLPPHLRFVNGSAFIDSSSGNIYFDDGSGRCPDPAPLNPGNENNSYRDTAPPPSEPGLTNPATSGSATVTGQTLRFGPAANIYDIPPGCVLSISYRVQVLSSMPLGTLAENAADADWSTVNGNNPNERRYEDQPTLDDGGNDDDVASTQIIGLEFEKVFSPPAVDLGDTSVLTFTITNPNTVTDLTGIEFVDPLPNGFVIESFPGTGTCAGAVVGTTVGSRTISAQVPFLAAGASCTIDVEVRHVGATTGPFENNSRAITSVETGPGPIATAPIFVGTTVGMHKRFAPSPIAPGQVATLTFTLFNGTSLPIDRIFFFEFLPLGSPAGQVEVANPANATSTCPNVVNWAPNPGDIDVTFEASGGVVLAPGASCIVQVDITASTNGTYINQVDPAAGLGTLEAESGGTPQPISPSNQATLVVRTALGGIGDGDGSSGGAALLNPLGGDEFPESLPETGGRPLRPSALVALAILGGLIGLAAGLWLLPKRRVIIR